MNTFNQSAWAQKDFSENYLEKADIYILERRKLIGILSSLFSYFFNNKTDIRVLDLGCGDGVLTGELLTKDSSIIATLVDGSQSMLQKARERFKAHRKLNFVNASFQDILADKTSLGLYDFCISSLAIHHLELEEKVVLFKYITRHLNNGGRFVNIDVVLPPSEELEGWYFAIWKEWMHYMVNKLNMKNELPEDIIKRYKDPSSMNKPDTLEVQLDALKEAGLLDVDCYYKNGIFAVFGGKK